jgi:hypothetical protein
VAHRTLIELQEIGWIACSNVGHLGLLGRGFSSRWRLTWRGTNPALGVGAYQDAATKDFARLSAKDVKEALKAKVRSCSTNGKKRTSP